MSLYGLRDDVLNYNTSMTFLSLAWDREDFLFSSVKREEQKQVNPFNKATNTEEKPSLSQWDSRAHIKNAECVESMGEDAHCK